MEPNLRFRQKPIVQLIVFGLFAGGVSQVSAAVTGCTNTGGTVSTAETTQCTVNNGDTLTVAAAGSVTVANWPVNVTGGATAISNSGLINSNTGNGAILVNGVGATLSGGITNSGTIRSANDTAIFIWSSTVGTITNNGTITALNNGANQGAISVDDGTTVSSIVNNAGATISGAGPAGASRAGILIYGASSTITSSITNAGTISGTSYAILDKATGGNANVSTINITGSSASFSGDVKVLNADVYVKSGGTFSNTNAFETKSFNIENTATFNMGVGTKIALGQNGVKTTNGFSNSGTLSIAAGVTPLITGNYTQASTGTFKTTLTNDTTFGKVSVTGTATLPSSAKIDVNVTGSPALTVGTTLSNVIAAATLTSDGTYSVTDNSLLYNFRAVKNGNAVDIIIDKGLAVADSLAATGNKTSGGAGAVLDRIASSGNASTAMNNVLTTLSNLGSSTAVSNAVNQTLPLLTGNSQMAANSALSGINRVIQARIDANRGMSSGDDFIGDKNFWMKPFASRADQNDRNGVSGYKATVYGLAVGVDHGLSPALRVGGAFAYAKSDINSKSPNAPQGTDIDIYQLIGYGSYALNERAEFNFQVDMGQNKNAGRRQIPFMSAEATSRYSTDTAHLGIGIGRGYPLSSQTTLTPSVRVDYTWLRDRSYTETGAGALNLAVNGRTSEAFLVSTDAKVAHQLSDETTVTANVGLGYDAMSKQSSITAAFAGSGGGSFVTYGLDPRPWVVNAGIGAIYKTRSGLEMTGRYDTEHRSGFLNQTASLKLRWAF